MPSPETLTENARTSEKDLTTALSAARKAAHHHLMAATALESALYDVQYDSGALRDIARYRESNENRERAQRAYDDLKHVRL